MFELKTLMAVGILSCMVSMQANHAQAVQVTPSGKPDPGNMRESSRPED
jgi:hypothetical protein